MPNLKDIQRRIGSVKKTQQITRAMRMVAGAKLRRAQSAIEAARPYAERMQATLAEIARSQRDAEHALLQSRESVKKIEVVVVTSDRGLCGGFNASAAKHAKAMFEQRRPELDELVLTHVGRKGKEALRREPGVVEGEFYPLEGWVDYPQAADIARRLARRYAEGEVDEVRLVFNEFISTMNQTPRDLQLLPFHSEVAEPGNESEEALAYEIEPSATALLATLVPRAVEVAVYRALLENQAGEHAARMAAMEAATRNTEELIDSLTLQFNRARQAAITKELVEIVSGAEAL
ncbi:ATP synthase F1 subunit gamma [Myxococcota bacterium]|nr:ATP synthase F1 subunit gamma [Myxococcota bacterium]